MTAPRTDKHWQAMLDAGHPCSLTAEYDFACQIETELAAVTAERDKLKAKCGRQRTELRRLNKTLRSMWEGVRFAHKVQRHMEANWTPAYQVKTTEQAAALDDMEAKP